MYLLYIGRKSTYININLFCSFRIGKLFFQYTHFVKYFNLKESDIIILCYCYLIKCRVWRNDNIAWRHFLELNNGMMVPPPFHLSFVTVIKFGEQAVFATAESVTTPLPIFVNLILLPVIKLLTIPVAGVTVHVKNGKWHNTNATR